MFLFQFLLLLGLVIWASYHVAPILTNLTLKLIKQSVWINYYKARWINYCQKWVIGSITVVHYWHRSIISELQSITLVRIMICISEQCNFTMLLYKIRKNCFISIDSYNVMPWEVLCVVIDADRRHIHFSIGLTRWFAIIATAYVDSRQKLY